LHNAVFDLPPYRGKWPEIWIAAVKSRDVVYRVVV